MVLNLFAIRRYTIIIAAVLTITNVKLGLDTSDATIADLMTDGCTMGVKSLNQYLNEYKAADEVSKDITKRLINLEERLAIDIRGYL